MPTKLLFDVGDIVDVTSYTRPADNGKGQIVSLRHAVGNHRTGDLCAGADVLLHNGRVRFIFLHDLASMNKDKLTALAPAHQPDAA